MLGIRSGLSVRLVELCIEMVFEFGGWAIKVYEGGAICVSG